MFLKELQQHKKTNTEVGEKSIPGVQGGSRLLKEYPATYIVRVASRAVWGRVEQFSNEHSLSCELKKGGTAVEAATIVQAPDGRLTRRRNPWNSRTSPRVDSPPFFPIAA